MRRVAAISARLPKREAKSGKCTRGSIPSLKLGALKITRLLSFVLAAGAAYVCEATIWIRLVVYRFLLQVERILVVIQVWGRGRFPG